MYFGLYFKARVQIEICFGSKMGGIFKTASVIWCGLVDLTVTTLFNFFWRQTITPTKKLKMIRTLKQ